MGKKILRCILDMVLLFIVIVVVSSALASIPSFRGKNLRVPFNGDTSKSCLVDDREIFDSATEKELNSMIRSYSDKLGMNIVVFVSGTRVSDDDTPDFTANTYDSMMGEEFTDGVLLYLDFSGKSPAYDYLSCSGKACVIYGEKPSDITDKLGSYLPASGHSYTADDIAPAIKEFCQILDDYDSKYKTRKFFYTKDSENGIYFFDTGKDFYATKEPAPGMRRTVLIISFTIGAIIGYIIYFVTRRKYRFKNKTNPSIYVSHEMSNFTEKSDTFIRTYVSKTKIETSSGGGSRGGGGGGHSGGHVGGGSHR